MSAPCLNFPFLNSRTNPLQGLLADRWSKTCEDCPLFCHCLSRPEGEIKKIKAYPFMLSLSRFLAGKTALTPRLAIRIAAALGSTPEFWLRLQNAYDLRQLENQIDTSGIVLYGEQDEMSQVISKL
ncbi:HigA family addiction module antitoxin [Photorhabdus bodei]